MPLTRLAGQKCRAGRPIGRYHTGGWGLDDPTISNPSRSLTLAAYPAQLVGQPGKVVNLLFDLGQMLRRDLVHLGTRLILLRGQAQQVAHPFTSRFSVPGY
jgi:hypothetical protein